MKIKSIHINGYKNIRNQTLSFSQDAGYLALIGLNGSGKSNWLEAVSMIFRDLHGIEVNFAYEMVLEQGGNEYHVSHKQKKGGGYTTTFLVDGKTIRRSAVALPRVVACYSGENNRLWRMAYQDYYNQYFKLAIRNKIDFPEMLYVNKYFWNVALISLLCSDDPRIRDFLQRHLGLSNLDDVQVSFDLLPDNIEKFQSNKATQFLSRIYKGDATTTIPMAELASLEIDHRSNIDFCRKMFYYLFITSLPVANDVNPVNKAIKKIEVSIKGVSTYSLSEGEQKMILVTCLTMLLGDDNTMLIFDEPDAHVHIANKQEIVSAISAYQGQTLLTSHSPIIVDDLKPECIRYIEYGVANNADKIEAVSRLSENRISLLDGTFILSSKKLIVTEGPYDIYFIKTAVKKLGEDDARYLRLNTVSFVFIGSANNAKAFFEEVVKPIVNDMEKILFIFDYDVGNGRNANGQKGYDAIAEIKEEYRGKLDCMYYASDYTKSPDIFYVEDYFSPDCYTNERAELNGVSSPPLYRDMKRMGGVVAKIKKVIENNYTKFGKDKYQNFKPLLDKLLNAFGLD